MLCRSLRNVTSRRPAAVTVTQPRFSSHSYPPSVSGITRTRNWRHLDDKEFGPITAFLVSLIEKTGFDKFYVSFMGYQKYGLHFEDILVETPDVAKALSRVPAEDLSDRDDRCKEALVLHAAGDILPRERWTQPSDENGYLFPYLKQVVIERRDRELFRPQ